MVLNHWGRVVHIRFGNQTIIVSANVNISNVFTDHLNFTDHWSLSYWQSVSTGFGNGLVPNRRQAINWTNTGTIH